jgi:hypothetical protein
MCDEWLQNMDNGNLNCVVFLGVRKAFDSINHEILLQKMHDHFGIIGTELEWFKSYTRSYYRKESAASPPRVKGSMHNLLNKGPFI